MSERGNFLKKDDYAFGAFVALISPVILLLLIHYGGGYLADWMQVNNFQAGKFYPFSLLLNLFLIRYYLVTIKLVKTGKSIVVVTFIIVLLYFFFIKKI